VSFKVDLHTHSKASFDGGIKVEQYLAALENKVLNCIAITDHNRIDFAQNIQKELGSNQIIVGQEITTKQGDIIGLFLASAIKANQNITDVVKEIKSQGGLVYIPHPFETIRSGVNKQNLVLIQESIDIIEGINGRAFFQNFSSEAQAWALELNIPTAASSDAHRSGALGKTYTTINQIPTAKNLTTLLQKAKLTYKRPSFVDIMAPKMNRIIKTIVSGNK
jgi:predicted metal-dependent phosphoesterase TrpH